MSSLTTSCIVLACVFGGALVTMYLRRALPEHHLIPDSKDVVKLGMGLIATLAALVLGLLVASAKGTYDTQSSAVKQMAAQVMLLDRALGLYGPETKEARELLRRNVAANVEGIWPKDRARGANLAPSSARAEGDAFYEMVAMLSPKTDAQRALKGRALDVTTDLTQTRFRLFAQKDSSIPFPFLVVLVSWLVILFGGYGLLAPRNATVLAALLVCALSVSGAVFLILELDRPFDGIVRVSSAPLQDALSRFGE